jgi:hypothetical protein
MSTQQTLLLIASILIGFPIAFVAIWSLVCWLIAWMGGWRRLVSVYPARGTPVGKRYGGVYGMMGISSYKGVLTVVVAPEGLHLSTMSIFRPGHPPLLIPWAALRNGEAWPFLWARAMRYTIVAPVTGAAITTITLPELLFEGQTEIQPTTVSHSERR